MKHNFVVLAPRMSLMRALVTTFDGGALKMKK